MLTQRLGHFFAVICNDATGYLSWLQCRRYLYALIAITSFIFKLFPLLIKQKQIIRQRGSPNRISASTIDA
jgi:hypothetical protein